MCGIEQKGGSKRRSERKLKAKEKPLTEEEKRAKEERRQLRQASRKLLRAMCHMRGMTGYRDRPIIDILSAEYEVRSRRGNTWHSPASFFVL